MNEIEYEYLQETTLKQRDKNIQKAYTKEIDLSTKVIQDKSKYNRKEKHKKNYKKEAE